MNRSTHSRATKIIPFHRETATALSGHKGNEVFRNVLSLDPLRERPVGGAAIIALAERCNTIHIVSGQGDFH